MAQPCQNSTYRTKKGTTGKKAIKKGSAIIWDSIENLISETVATAIPKKTD